MVMIGFIFQKYGNIIPIVSKLNKISILIVRILFLKIIYKKILIRIILIYYKKIKINSLILKYKLTSKRDFLFKPI